jgi:hypothetical protein
MGWLNTRESLEKSATYRHGILRELSNNTLATRRMLRPGDDRSLRGLWQRISEMNTSATLSVCVAKIQSDIKTCKDRWGDGAKILMLLVAMRPSAPCACLSAATNHRSFAYLAMFVQWNQRQIQCGEPFQA